MYPLYTDPAETKYPGDRLRQSLWYALPKFLRGQIRSFGRGEKGDYNFATD
jgi:hypothetical protein